AGGTQWSSEDVAARLEGWASPAACLVVGGPLGLHPSLLERASVRWSLSRLTFPHELVRVLVAEQLYRALSILRGLPYHRGSPCPSSGACTTLPFGCARHEIPDLPVHPRRARRALPHGGAL